MKQTIRIAAWVAVHVAAIALTICTLKWAGAFPTGQEPRREGALSGVVFLQRIADGSGVLAPEERAFALPTGWTITDVPAGALAGTPSGPGQVTGYSQLVAPAVASLVTIGIPSVGSTSFVDGTERNTSDRLTVSDTSVHSLLALPMASNDFGTVSVELMGADETAGGSVIYGIPPGGGVLIGSGSMAPVGTALSPTVTNTIGLGSAVSLVYGSGYLSIAVQGPSPGTTGSTDATNAGLYGPSGTLAGGGTGLTLILSFNGIGSTLTFDGTGVGNDNSLSAMLTAIQGHWASAHAAVGGSGGNKLQLWASTSVVVGAGTANSALGLTPGTYASIDTVLWVASMHLNSAAE